MLFVRLFTGLSDGLLGGQGWEKQPCFLHVPRIVPWIFSSLMNILWQSHEFRAERNLDDWLRIDWKLNPWYPGEWATKQLSLACRRGNTSFSFRELAPGVYTGWLSRNPAVPAKTTFSGLTTKAFCMEQQNICNAFCPNVFSTAFRNIPFQGNHITVWLGKHPKFPLW